MSMNKNMPQESIREGFASLTHTPSTHSSRWQPATQFATRPPLIHPTEAELKVAFAENLFDLFRAMSHLPGAELQESAQLCRHLAAPFNPMFKGVWQSRLAEHEADETIAATVAWFKTHNAPFAFWWVDPQATPHDLGERLQAQGLVAWEVDAPGMAADLNNLRYD
jgi:hypothetical protein